MRRTILTLFVMTIALLFSSTAAAQVPAVVPVQGVLNAADGTPVDGDTPITFTFYDGSDNSLWTETFSVAVDNGFFAVGLGAGNTALDLTIFETNSEIELGIKVGSDDEMSPRMQVGSVPFALRSQWSDQALDAAALEGQTLADLDNRYLSDVPDDSVTSAKTADGSVTSSDVSNPVTIYRVENLNCEVQVGTLMTSPNCYARQDGASSCSNSCSGFTPARRTQCDGSCGCGPLVLCPVGQPCNPRSGWPQCPNTELGVLIPSTP